MFLLCKYCSEISVVFLGWVICEWNHDTSVYTSYTYTYIKYFLCKWTSFNEMCQRMDYNTENILLYNFLGKLTMGLFKQCILLNGSRHSWGFWVPLLPQESLHWKAWKSIASLKVMYTPMSNFHGVMFVLAEWSLMWITLKCAVSQYQSICWLVCLVAVCVCLSISFRPSLSLYLPLSLFCPPFSPFVDLSIKVSTSICLPISIDLPIPAHIHHGIIDLRYL